MENYLSLEDSVGGRKKVVDIGTKLLLPVTLFWGNTHTHTHVFHVDLTLTALVKKFIGFFLYSCRQMYCPTKKHITHHILLFRLCNVHAILPTDRHPIKLPWLTHT